MSAIRAIVEAGGYTFHGIHMKPTAAVAGLPDFGNNGVNPAFRKTIMHADIWESLSWTGASVQELKQSHVRFNGYMDRIREATPGAGSYINEADVQEPNWQQSFFGDKYQILLDVKQSRDPWELFWAPTTVGSEGWEVITADGLPTQNGMLCRV
jgi:Berberine and berberine like